MRGPVIAIFLVGAASCDKGEQAPPAPAPAPPVSPAVGPPIDAAAPPDAPTIDAPPPIPPDLLAAPVWAGRSLYTGKIRAKAVHTRATLQRVNTRALLTLEVREQPLRLNGDPDPWGAPVTRQILATYADSKLAYTDGKDPVSLECAIKTVTVAGASAVRIREGKGGCEGDQGKWSPRATRKTKALVCGDMTSEMDSSFTFVEPPGPELEWVYVNDDCSMQGGGYRDVPKDGSIVSPR